MEYNLGSKTLNPGLRTFAFLLRGSGYSYEFTQPLLSNTDNYQFLSHAETDSLGKRWTAPVLFDVGFQVDFNALGANAPPPGNYSLEVAILHKKTSGVLEDCTRFENVVIT